MTLLASLVFLAGSLAHAWHHCCEGWHVADADHPAGCHAPTDAADKGWHPDYRCLALYPGEEAVIHHHHHACCEHTLSPAIDDAIQKTPIQYVTLSVWILPVIGLVQQGDNRPGFNRPPPSTLLRTGRKLLASHCVLRH